MAPIVFFWGGQDRGIPPEQHRMVADALRLAEKRFVDVEFSDAFFNEQVAERYNADATEVAKYNGLLPNSVLGAGREIKIPSK